MPGPPRLGARGGVSPAGGCKAPMRSPRAGACGGGNCPQRSLLAGRSGLWRGAAPPRSSGTSPEQKTSVHVAPAERHEATHRALSPGGRWRAASCTAWRYWGQRSCEWAHPTCMCTGVSSGPPHRKHGCGRTATPLHRRVAVSGPQHPAVGGRRGEVPGVDIGCGVGPAQRCVSSVRQRMVRLRP